MSKCTVIFNINSADGTSTPILVEVPDVDNLTLEDAVRYLMENDKDTFNKLLESVNRSGFPVTNFKISDFNNTIPIGNYTINQLVNDFNNTNIDYLKRRLEELGVDTNKLNILVTTAVYPKNSKNVIGIYEKDGKSIALLRPNETSVEPYLKQLLVSTIYDLKDALFRDLLWGYIQPILAKLENTPRVTNIVKSIQEAKDPTKEFIRYYYASSTFSHAMYKSGQISVISKLFNELIDTQLMYANQYSDPIVQDFSLEIKDNRISIENLLKYQELLGTSNVIETLQEINNRADGKFFFDIDFIGEKEVLFKRTKQKPVFETDVINSEYYGELVEPVMSINGYNIIKHNNQYYISRRIIRTTENLKSKGFNTLNQAKGILNYKLETESLSLTGIVNKVKYGDVAVESKLKLEVGERFIALNIPLLKTTLMSQDKKLGGLSYNGFMNEMEKSALWSKVLEGLPDYNISNILNTPEKVETFILLRALLRNMEEYKKVYTNKSPRIDTPDKVEFERNLTKEALDLIKNAKEEVYEVINKNKNNYEILKVTVKDDIPIYKKKKRSFKSELLDISEHLSRNFGIKVNILTTFDILKLFKDIVPNAGRVNAFILNNEVFVNIDNATTADPLHEFAHLIMGTIKRNKPELYYGLVSLVEQLPDYASRLDKLSGDKRARTDKNEEIFVSLFGEYFAKEMNPWFENKTESLEELGKQFKKGTLKVLQTEDAINSERVGKLLNMSIDEIMSEFGSALINNDIDIDSDIAYQSRRISNLIKKLIDSDKLIESCE